MTIKIKPAELQADYCVQIAQGNIHRCDQLTLSMESNKHQAQVVSYIRVTTVLQRLNQVKFKELPLRSQS